MISHVMHIINPAPSSPISLNALFIQSTAKLILKIDSSYTHHPSAKSTSMLQFQRGIHTLHLIPTPTIIQTIHHTLLETGIGAIAVKITVATDRAGFHTVALISLATSPFTYTVPRQCPATTTYKTIRDTLRRGEREQGSNREDDGELHCDRSKQVSSNYLGGIE